MTTIILMTMKVFAYALAPLLDRYRGDARDILNSLAEKFMYGACVMILALSPEALKGDENDLIIGCVLFVLLFALGSSPGWSCPFSATLHGREMSSNHEWWQVGTMLKESKYLAIHARGVIWGACMLPACYFVPEFFSAVIAVMIAFPSSVILMSQYRDGSMDAWAETEVLRGLITGLVTLALSELMSS